MAFHSSMLDGSARGRPMATVKKGMLTKTGEWWKHLRWMKRTFWKGERRVAKQLSRRETALDVNQDR
jgi:hypothetical protein